MQTKVFAIFAILVSLLIGVYILTGSLSAGEIYRWVDKNGNIVFSDSPPPSGNFSKQNIQDEIDKTVEQKKQVEERTDINEDQKTDERIRLEIEYQKKAKALRDYQTMKEDLEVLKEKYQKKFDELKRQWNRNFPGSSSRHDIREEVKRLQQEYDREVKETKKLYGY